MCFGCTPNGKIWWSFTFAAISFAFSITIGVIWPSLFTTMLSTQMQLTEYTTLYKNWVTRPIPLYLEVYMFNWSNVQRVENWREEKPHFNQLGPYVFEEYVSRVNLEYSADELSVFFHDNKTWFYRPDLSTGHLGDRVFNLNPISTTMSWVARYAQSYPKVLEMFNQALDQYSSLYVGKSVGEWLFDGFNEGLLDILQEFLSSGLIPPGIPIPDFPLDKFGWFYQRNGTAGSSGRYEIWTGKDDINKVGIMKTWNGKDTVPGLRDDCAKIIGTTAEVWPPPNKRQDVSFFIPDVCRSLTFKREGTYQKHGLKGYKWVGDDRVFDNGEKYPEAKCWCTAPEEQCPVLKAGVFDASKCLFGSPGFISFPHFYLAHHSYLDAVDGMNPSKELHESLVALEPASGIPLEAQAKFQINLFLRNDPKLEMFKDVPNLYVPMLWFNQNGGIDYENAQQVKFLPMARDFGAWTSGILAGVGVLLLAVGGVFMYMKRKSKSGPTTMDFPQ